MSKYTIGIDYGTDSVRSIMLMQLMEKKLPVQCLIIPLERRKIRVPSQNQFRQHPLDYIEGLENSVKEALAKAPKEVAANIVAISVDTTGSTL